MAKRVTEVISDDLDGTEGASTVLFGFEGAYFEIDLSPANRDVLLNALTPFMDAGRRHRPVNGYAAAPMRNRVRGETRDFDLGELRTWAQTNGIDLPARGRIPGDIVTLFKNRNNKHERVKVKADA